jgi:CubicO group peptidase (beta-lactamase class C family)
MTDSTFEAGLAQLREAMAARVASGERPGMVYLVARGDDVHVDTIGSMAFGSPEPMRRDTIFRIASMTKPILAAATMMLVDDGQLALDEPVDQVLPELANRRVLERIDGPLDETVAASRPITLEDLLTFRMGHGMLFEPSFMPPYPIVSAADELQLVMAQPDPRTPHGPDEWLRRFGTLPLMYQPGERWQYNTGSLVLGVLVARAAKQPLGDFFKSRIFEPLGMRDTGFSMPAEHAARLPSYYLRNFQTGQVELQTMSSASEWTGAQVFPSGAAGLLSTVDDFLLFARLLLSGGEHQGKRLLSEASVKLMTSNSLTPAQIAGGGPVLGGQGWGFGMAVSVAPDDISPVPGRYGWAGGYGTTWFNDPHRDVVAIAMTQTPDFLFNGGATEFSKLANTP